MNVNVYVNPLTGNKGLVMLGPCFYGKFETNSVVVQGGKHPSMKTAECFVVDIVVVLEVFSHHWSSPIVALWNLLCGRVRLVMRIVDWMGGVTGQ